MYGSKETIPGKRLVVSSSWPYKVNGKALLYKFCGFKLTFYIMACIIDVIFDDNRPLKFTIMKYENIVEILDKANFHTELISKQMNDIFKQYPELDAPEFMPEPSLSQWNELYKLGMGINERIERVLQATQTLNHYLNMEII